MVESLPEQVGVIYHLGRLEQQPRSLDVMAVALYVAPHLLPVIVKEEREMACDGMLYAVEKYAQQSAGSLLHYSRVEDVVELGREHTTALARLALLECAQQVGISLDDVEMGVHGLGGIGVLVAQTHVGYGLP